VSRPPLLWAKPLFPADQPGLKRRKTFIHELPPSQIMKTSLLALILLLFVHVAAVPKTKPEVGSHRAATRVSGWPPSSTVKVHFVRGLFTSEQKQILWQTLETWAQKAEATRTIRFSYAGETGGLIDCLGCLTLTRQEVFTNDSRRQVSFNRLRGDQSGQLISAWIGFDTSISNSQKLTRLLLHALGAEIAASR